MLKEFFKNTNSATFIKALISNTNLPTIDTTRRGDYIYADEFYIYKDRIIKCTRTGYLDDDSCDLSEKGEYEEKQLFHMGEPIINLTRTYFQENSYYDTELHRHLGTFLRCLRDTENIDLMGMYNCFTYQMEDELHLTANGYTFTHDDFYKVFKVPIKLNTTYTVAIESPTGVIIKPLFWNDLRIIEVDTVLVDGKRKHVDGYECLAQIVKGVTSFYQPFTFRVEAVARYVELTGNAVPENPKKADLYELVDGKYIHTEDTEKNQDKHYFKRDTEPCENMHKHEKYLYAFIQLPRRNASSVVVLEGDFTGTQKFQVASIPSMEQGDQLVGGSMYQMENDSLNSLYFNNRFLSFNDGTTYAFDSKLIQYLTNNVISNYMQVPKNIQRAREALAKYTPGLPTEDVWDTDLRRLAYNRTMYKLGVATRQMYPKDLLLKGAGEVLEKENDLFYMCGQEESDIPKGATAQFYNGGTETVEISGALEAADAKKDKMYVVPRIYEYGINKEKQNLQPKTFYYVYIARQTEEGYEWEILYSTPPGNIYQFANEDYPVNTVYDITGFIDRDVEEIL